jgi:hypothetical protein
MIINAIIMCINDLYKYTHDLIQLFINFTPFIVVELSGMKLDSFKKNIKYASRWITNQPSGIIIGKWYIGMITEEYTINGMNSKTTLIILRKQFINVNKMSNLNHREPENNINDIIKNALTKSNSTIESGQDPQYFFLNSYRVDSIPIKIPRLQPTLMQMNVVLEIANIYKTSRTNNTVVVLNGEPGCGKSSVAYFLIKHLYQVEKKKEVCFIDTFNPTETYTFNFIYHTIKPSNDKPLIILLDEIDRIFDIINNYDANNNNSNRNPMMRDKIDWNRFFDQLNGGLLYQNVIIIMTTNKPIDYFDDKDPAYFRQGRVNAKIRMTGSCLDLVQRFGEEQEEEQRENIESSIINRESEIK